MEHTLPRRMKTQLLRNATMDMLYQIEVEEGYDASHYLSTLKGVRLKSTSNSEVVRYMLTKPHYWDYCNIGYLWVMSSSLGVEKPVDFQIRIINTYIDDLIVEIIPSRTTWRSRWSAYRTLLSQADGTIIGEPFTGTLTTNRINIQILDNYLTEVMDESKGRISTFGLTEVESYRDRYSKRGDRFGLEMVELCNLGISKCLERAGTTTT